MRVNYVLMYGTPYLKYREFETFEDISKFLINKNIVNYSIFKKLEDKEEVEMIYRDNDIRYLEKENKRLNNSIKQKDNTLKEIREYMNKHEIEEVYLDCKLYETQAYKDILEILDKGSDKE